MERQSKRTLWWLALLLPLIALLASPVGATNAPTMTVTDSGTTSGAANATVLDSVIAAPISMLGQTASEVSATWSTSEARLANTSSIVRPEGWNLEYTTDGMTWSSTPPSPLSSVTGIRSSGTVRSQGLDGAGLQVSSRPSQGTILPVAGAIQGGVGGDGYGITFAGTRVLNVWHHYSNGTIIVDCHLRATGAQCPRVTVTGPYHNGNNSLGGYHDASQRFYSPVVNISTNEMGFVCVDYSLSTPAACSTPFIAVSDASTTPASLNAANLGGATVEGNRFYLVNARDNKLLCLDMATAAPCSNFGLTGFTTAPHSPTYLGNYGWSSDASAIGGRVYLIMSNQMGCVDPTTNPVSWCNGSSPITLTSNGSPIDVFNVPPFPVYNPSGVLQMVCDFVARNCITSAGATATIPSAIATFVASTPIAGSPYLQYSVFEWTTKENKLFWPTELGGVNYGGWANDAACFDFTTNAPCTGGDIPGVKYDVSLANGASGRLYAFAADPDPDMPCVWANSDAGVISTFSTTLGSCSGNAVTRFTYNESVPRMSCDEPGRVREWRDLVITLPNGINANDLRLTIKDSAQAPQTIPGWSNVPLTSTTIDLSSISVATSGTRPTFLITGINKTAADVTGLVADITYVSDPPQLCFELEPVAVCALGVPTSGRTAVEPFTIDGEVTATGANTLVTPVDAQVSSASIDTTSCPTGDIEGTTTEQGTSVPMTGIVVRLVHPTTGATILQTTTNSAGEFSFTGLNVGAYLVQFGSSSTHSLATNAAVTATVVAAGVAQADAEYALNPVAVASPAESHALPITGANLVVALLAAIALIGGGGLLLGIRRLRTTSD